MADPYPIQSAAEMRAAEQRTINGGRWVGTLMDRAGAAVADAAWRVAGAVDTLILCGPGNNGGDGYVAACELRARGVPVRIATFAPPATDVAKAAAQRWNGPTTPLSEARSAPLVIDA